MTRCKTPALSEICVYTLAVHVAVGNIPSPFSSQGLHWPLKCHTFKKHFYITHNGIGDIRHVYIFVRRDLFKCTAFSFPGMTMKSKYSLGTQKSYTRNSSALSLYIKRKQTSCTIAHSLRQYQKTNLKVDLSP